MVKSVMDVLRGHGYAVTEVDIADRLEVLLTRAGSAAGASLSEAETNYLAVHAGVQSATAAERHTLQTRSAARAAGEAAATLNRRQLAERLGLDPTGVSRQTVALDLYSYRSGAGRPVYPDWQLIDDETRGKDSVLPHLGQVIRALPSGAHPVTVRTFMTTPTPDLQIDGRDASPRDWLIGGGDPNAVAGTAASLGEQV